MIASIARSQMVDSTDVTNSDDNTVDSGAAAVAVSGALVCERSRAKNLNNSRQIAPDAVRDTGGVAR
jgi:hypothetical protein